MNMLQNLCLIVLIAFVQGRRRYYNENMRESSTKIATIVRGVKTEIDLFPWLAVLTKYKAYHCGGVIISDRVILTAAHCVFKDGVLQRPEIYQVLLGSTQIMKGAPYDVCFIKPYSRYNPERTYNYYYDLTLMLLNQRIKFNKRVQRAYLVPHDDWRTPHSTFIVAGYGRLQTEGDVADNLQMTTMSYISNAECNSSKTSEGKMPAPNFMFCMLGDRPTSDCYGDSGTGVMWGGFVVGIVSTGRSYHCGLSDTPSMYTSVFYFKDWIRDSIKDLESGVHGCILTNKYY